MADEFRQPIPTFEARVKGSNYVSTIVSADASVSGLTSGSVIDVTGLKNITAFVSRGASGSVVELEFSPNGTNWWQWKNFTAASLPAGGDIATFDLAVSGATASFVRGVYNVSGTASSPLFVILNAQAK